MEMKPFTESDWDGFCGAERPDAKTEPLIGECEKIARDLHEFVKAECKKWSIPFTEESWMFCIIADANGIQINNVDNSVSFTLDCSFKTASFIALHLGIPLTLADILDAGLTS